METYSNDDGTIFKFVHDSGAETAIKTMTGCVNYDNKLTGVAERISSSNTYTVFISSSVGCRVMCKHCYLTAKSFPFYKLSSDEIVDQTIQAITEATKSNPNLRSKKIKLSLMGMGDAIASINDIDIPWIVCEILQEVVKRKLASGVNSIDIGTAVPNRIKKHHNQMFQEISDILKRFDSVRLQPRLFVSLFSFDEDIRKQIVPASKDTLQACLKLRDFPVELIFHNVLIKGVNDSVAVSSITVDILNRSFPKSELRIISLNMCKDSKVDIPDMATYKQNIEIFNNGIGNLKVQYSPGDTIKAACGQFLMKKS